MSKSNSWYQLLNEAILASFLVNIGVTDLAGVAIQWQRTRSAITFLGSLKSRAGVTKPSRKFSTIQSPFNNLYYGIDSPEISKTWIIP